MTPDAARAMHRRMIDQWGETVQVRRLTGTSPQVPFDADVKAKVSGYAPAELVGAIQQGDRKLIVMAEDLEGRGWPVPPRKGDRVVVQGKTLNVEAVDDNTRRVGGVLVAYEMTVRG